MNRVVIGDLLILDKAANYDILRGQKGETISSRCGRAIKRTANLKAGNWTWGLTALASLVDCMPWFGPNHCVRNIQSEFLTENDK